VRDLDEEYTACVRDLLPRLRRLGYLLSGDWYRADDLVQTTIEKMYDKWRRVRRADNVDAYARTILVRVFLSEQRSGWRSRVSVTADPPDAVLAGPDPDTALDVRRALATVPPRQRAVLVLRFFADLSIEQTAELLGCSPGTVKSQTAHGLSALRRALGDQDVAAAPSRREQRDG